jgi:hypothetical protein
MNPSGHFVCYQKRTDSKATDRSGADFSAQIKNQQADLRPRQRPSNGRKRRSRSSDNRSYHSYHAPQRVMIDEPGFASGI